MCSRLVAPLHALAVFKAGFRRWVVAAWPGQMPPAQSGWRGSSRAYPARADRLGRPLSGV